MRAREPDQSGYAVSNGVRVFYEVYGEGGPTVVLLPTWAIVHSRAWKMQIPYLARHYRVVTFDPPGNGKTDRPSDPAAYSLTALVDNTFAVMDATETRTAVLVGHCVGGLVGMGAAHRAPERVLGLVSITVPIAVAPQHPERREYSFDDVLETDDGWAKYNRHYWDRDWPGFIDFFMGQITVEPHSTKVLDDLLGWGNETDAATMVADSCSPNSLKGVDLEEFARSLPCPLLVIAGDDDRIQPLRRSERVAELAGGELLVLEGAGHVPHVRHPVVVNHALRAFVDRVVPPAPRTTPWLFARERHPKALWISSPIGLGHVLRDLAIANAVRTRVPELRIEWLAQPPVTGVLEAAGEIIHPASQELASESAHWESEASGHELHAFEAFRRMDEILCANYLLFDDVAHETPYDLWIGDEAWEVDHFLHENPERKTAPYVFTTDVIGFLPTAGDERELALTADYNAELIEHRERYPRVRDLSLFIGTYDELPDASFGPGLPRIRDWSQRWFESVPYVVPFDPRDYRDPRALRARLGYDLDAPLLAAAVGGTSVGRDLLELVADGFAHLRKEVPDARMVMVTGPRIDPADVPDVEGLDKHGFLPESFAHLAAADAAVVQGGLSTTMELVAARRPFVYFPLAQHWEQEHFVAHRLRHYRAGLRMDYARTTPSDLADAMLRAMAQRPRYRAVPRDGAAVAGARIASLLTG